jgi:hypothetical protein
VSCGITGHHQQAQYIISLSCCLKINSRCQWEEAVPWLAAAGVGTSLGSWPPLGQLEGICGQLVLPLEPGRTVGDQSPVDPGRRTSSKSQIHYV